MIIAISGNPGAGRQTVASLLEGMNFYRVSFSDLLKEELIQKKKPLNWQNLQEIGTEIRNEYGQDHLAKQALKKVKDGENYVFTSIYNLAELKYLLKRQDFLLVRVEAPEKLRLKRILEKNKEDDLKTVEELKKKEQAENSKDDESRTITKLSKVILVNDSTIEELQKKVEALVKDHLYVLREKRIDWDHYFMNIAEQVKMRCNCLSAKKGAIIVKEKMIISTGYNGTPKNITHCTSGGCQRCTSRHLGKLKSGQYSEPCICCHSEENAIVQAAYNGVCTKDAIMYTTFTPCTTCAKMIINAGIKEVIAKVEYPDDVGTKLLQEAGVKLKVLK